MTRILSVIFYFLSYHSMLAMPVILLFFVFVGAVLAQLRKQQLWYLVVIPGLIVAPMNVFFGHFLNSSFLNAAGVEGTGVIVHSRQTDDMLNNQWVWEYNVVLKTQDGRDVTAKFDTWTASIYPMRNEILIPPEGQPFIVRYVPGFERNFVIMSDESEYGKQIRLKRDFEPVQKAHEQLTVSPNNPAFINEYRKALETFLAAHRNDLDPDTVKNMEEELQGLGSPAGK